MSVIGTFTSAKDGGWNGSIQTLTINTKVRLVPNDNRENENAPAFLIFAGRSELGAAWQQRRIATAVSARSFARRHVLVC